MESKITGNRYVLAVKNLEKSADFYKDKLGFHTLWEGGGWHFLTRDTISIMLGGCPDDQPASEINCHSYFAYLEVENIDQLYEQGMETIGDNIECRQWRISNF